jgi:hypothetical protein
VGWLALYAANRVQTVTYQYTGGPRVTQDSTYANCSIRHTIQFSRCGKFLEAAKVAEQTEAEAEDEPVEDPRRFSTNEMAIAFREIASAMARLRRWTPIPHDS